MDKVFPTAWRLADLPKPTADAPRVMSTFACGGGSSMGYKLAGYNVVAANDIDPKMAENYKRNLSPKHYFLMPIADLVAKARKNDIPQELYDLDVLDGSPPCSTFSTAGLREKAWGKKKKFKEGQAEQVLDDLFFHYLDLVDALRPKVSIAENVEGMLLGSARGYIKEIVEKYKSLGYRAQLFLLNGADCQVPQRRKRVFFVAVREDLVKAHKLPLLQLEPKHPWVTPRQAFVDLPTASFAEDVAVDIVRPHHNMGWTATSASSGEKVVMSAEQIFQMTEPGRNVSHALQKRGYLPSHWNWVKLDANYPTGALTATAIPMHWSEHRFITCAEIYRLSSFPDDYVANTPAVGAYMCGMSVPPFMTREVARAVRSQWLDSFSKSEDG